MRYAVDEPVQCRFCGHIADDMADATDHAEDEHNIVSNAVLDSVEEVTGVAPEVEAADD